MDFRPTKKKLLLSLFISLGCIAFGMISITVTMHLKGTDLTFDDIISLWSTVLMFFVIVAAVFYLIFSASDQKV